MFTGQYLPGKLDPSDYDVGEETFISEELKANMLVI